jgi:hypothetical protein
LEESARELAESWTLCEMRCCKPREVGDTERAAGVSPDWLMIVGIDTGARTFAGPDAAHTTERTDTAVRSLVLRRL